MSIEHSPAQEGRRRRLAAPKLFDDDKLYSAREIADKLNVHVVTVWRWVRKGVLPKLRKIGPNTSRGAGLELNQSLAERMAEGESE